MPETDDEQGTRISVRVEPELYDAVGKVANRKYEGVFSMAAREAFRLLVQANADCETEPKALAS